MTIIREIVIVCLSMNHVIETIIQMMLHKYCVNEDFLYILYIIFRTEIYLYSTSVTSLIIEKRK